MQQKEEKSDGNVLFYAYIFFLYVIISPLLCYIIHPYLFKT